MKALVYFTSSKHIVIWLCSHLYIANDRRDQNSKHESDADPEAQFWGEAVIRLTHFSNRHQRYICRKCIYLQILARK